MEVLNDNPILKYHSDTLDYIRKKYNLNGRGRMNEAIDILEDWLKKQEHFTVKTFSRTFLERIIINNKGSLESCKRKLDKACTFRTLVPEYFANLNLDEYDGYKMFTNVLLMKMTPDYGRVMVLQCFGDKFEQLIDYYKYFILICEYIQAHDYSTGISYIVDCRQLNIVEFMKSIHFFDFKKLMDIAIEGYSVRIKGIHYISESKAIDLIVSFVRQIVSAKIGERIFTHKDVQSLYKVFPKDILPQEYGGKDKCVPELRDDLLNEIRSPEFIARCDEMKRAHTNEELRPRARFNEEYMGLSGTFRSLTVD